MGRKLDIKIYNAEGTQVVYDTDTVERTWGIDAGTFSIERIFMGDELKYGGLYATQVEFKIFGITESLKDRKVWINFNYDYIEDDDIIDDNDNDIVDDEDNNIIASGNTAHANESFVVYIDSCEEDAFGGDYVVTAYDKFYTLREVDIAQWWNTYIENNTTLNLRTFISDLLTSQSITVSNLTAIPELTFSHIYEVYGGSVSAITFEAVFSMACELACVTPILNDNTCSFKRLNDTEFSVSNNVETLDTVWEKYTTQPIDGIAFYGSANELLYASASATNAYKVVGNLFLNASTTAELQDVATSMMGHLGNITYTPMHIKFIESNPLHLNNMGCKFEVQGHYCYNNHIRIYGNQYIEEEVDCGAQGEYLTEEIINPYEELVFNHRVSKIERDLGNIHLEVNELERTTLRVFEVTDSYLDSNDSCVWLVIDPPGIIYEDAVVQGFRFALRIPTMSTAEANKYKYVQFQFTGGTQTQTTDAYPIIQNTTHVTNEFHYDDIIYFERNVKTIGTTNVSAAFVTTADIYTESSIDMVKDEIVLKVDSSGNIVEARLGASPTTGSFFEINADNLSFVANSTLSLTASRLNITSDNCSLTEDGMITSTNFKLQLDDDAQTQNYFRVTDPDGKDIGCWGMDYTAYWKWIYDTPADKEGYFWASSCTFRVAELCTQGTGDASGSYMQYMEYDNGEFKIYGLIDPFNPDEDERTDYMMIRGNHFTSSNPTSHHMDIINNTGWGIKGPAGYEYDSLIMALVQMRGLVKIKRFDISCSNMTNGMRLTNYVEQNLDVGYKFLCWIPIGTSGGWITSFPIYLVDPNLSNSSVWWSGTMPTTTGNIVIFTFLEIADV